MTRRSNPCTPTYAQACWIMERLAFVVWVEALVMLDKMATAIAEEEIMEGRIVEQRLFCLVVRLRIDDRQIDVDGNVLHPCLDTTCLIDLRYQ